MVENGGVVSRAMIDAGYSPRTAKVPSKLTDSQGFKEVWKELIPDDLVMKTHRRIIMKKDKDGQPHSDAVKGIDMAYKIDGAYAPEKHINLNLESEASPEIKELADRLNKMYSDEKKVEGSAEKKVEEKNKDSEKDVI